MCLVGNTGFDVNRYGEMMSDLCVQHIYFVLDQQFLGPIQIAGSCPPRHRLAKALHVAVKAPKLCISFLRGSRTIQGRGATG